jgi:hypothetical protein
MVGAKGRCGLTSYVLGPVAKMLIARALGGAVRCQGSERESGESGHQVAPAAGVSPSGEESRAVSGKDAGGSTVGDGDTGTAGKDAATGR